MYFDLLNISNTLPSGLASLEAVQLVQSKIPYSDASLAPLYGLSPCFLRVKLCLIHIKFT